MEILSDYKCASQRVPECGTVACIAGWALLLGKQRLVEGSPWYSVERRAEKILGLSKDSGESLFRVYGWPARLCEKYRSATTPAKRAKIAAARIDHLIATGE